VSVETAVMAAIAVALIALTIRALTE